MNHDIIKRVIFDQRDVIKDAKIVDRDVTDRAHRIRLFPNRFVPTRLFGMGVRRDGIIYWQSGERT